MGTTKDQIFSNATNEMANLLKALGHPARFEIINLLRHEKTCCGTKILNLIPLSQSTISKHLSELRNADIISCEQKGNSSNYSLNDSVLKRVGLYFNTSLVLDNEVVPENLLSNEVQIQNEIEKPAEKPKASAGFSFNKKSHKSNSNLKKENYVFKHLLLKNTFFK